MSAKKKATKPASKSRQAFVVNVHPHAAEFFIPGHKSPFSVMANGAEGSDAAAQLATRLTRLKKTHALNVHHFDANGQEVKP